MTCGKVLSALLPSAMEEVFDFPLRGCAIVVHVQLLQKR